MEKSPGASTSSSPRCLTFSLVLSFIHACSHFVSKTHLVPSFLVFLAIGTSFLVLLITSKSKLLCLSLSLCLLLSDLCCHWLSLGWPLAPRAASWRQLQGCWWQDWQPYLARGTETMPARASQVHPPPSQSRKCTLTW